MTTIPISFFRPISYTHENRVSDSPPKTTFDKISQAYFSLSDTFFTNPFLTTYVVEKINDKEFKFINEQTTALSPTIILALRVCIVTISLAFLGTGITLSMTALLLISKQQVRNNLPKTLITNSFNKDTSLKKSSPEERALLKQYTQEVYNNAALGLYLLEAVEVEETKTLNIEIGETQKAYPLIYLNAIPLIKHMIIWEKARNPQEEFTVLKIEDGSSISFDILDNLQPYLTLKTKTPENATITSLILDQSRGDDSLSFFIDYSGIDLSLSQLIKQTKSLKEILLAIESDLQSEEPKLPITLENFSSFKKSFFPENLSLFKVTPSSLFSQTLDHYNHEVISFEKSLEEFSIPDGDIPTKQQQQQLNTLINKKTKELRELLVNYSSENNFLLINRLFSKYVTFLTTVQDRFSDNVRKEHRQGVVIPALNTNSSLLSLFEETQTWHSQITVLEFCKSSLSRENCTTILTKLTGLIWFKIDFIPLPPARSRAQVSITKETLEQEKDLFLTWVDSWIVNTPKLKVLSIEDGIPTPYEQDILKKYEHLDVVEIN